MTRTVWPLLLAILLAAMSACAADDSARISGPVLGYVVDPDAAGVRPIHGIPGAATLGPLLNLGSEIHRAAIAQQTGHLLAVVGEDRQVMLYRNLAGEVSAAPLADAPPAPDRILLSPSGSAAALLYNDRGLLAVLTGLPEAPAVHRTLELASLPAGARVWAVSDDGARLLVSASAGETEAVSLVDAEGNLRLLLSAGPTTAAGFLAGSDEVVLADGLRNTVYWVRGEGEVIPLAGEKEGISGPVAVSISRDNRRVFVANAGAGTVVVLDLAGGAPSVFACDCTVTGLERMQGNAVFRLTDLSGDPMWLLDGDAPEARVVFVPPQRPVAQRAAQGDDK